MTNLLKKIDTVVEFERATGTKLSHHVHELEVPPPWSRSDGKKCVNFQGMLPGSGSILKGVHFWEVPFALMLSSGWSALL